MRYLGKSFRLSSEIEKWKAKSYRLSSEIEMEWFTGSVDCYEHAMETNRHANMQTSTVLLWTLNMTVDVQCSTSTLLLLY